MNRNNQLSLVASDFKYLTGKIPLKASNNIENNLSTDIVVLLKTSEFRLAIGSGKALLRMAAFRESVLKRCAIEYYFSEAMSC